MKHIFSTMVIAGAMTISTLSSCSKDDPGQIHRPPSTEQVTIYLTADHWQPTGYHMFVDVFTNVIPVRNADQPVKVFMVSNGTETQINTPVSVTGAEVWATTTQTDVAINVRSTTMTAPYLNIKVVIGN